MRLANWNLNVFTTQLFPLKGRQTKKKTHTHIAFNSFWCSLDKTKKSMAKFIASLCIIVNCIQLVLFVMCTLPHRIIDDWTYCRIVHTHTEKKERKSGSRLHRDTKTKSNIIVYKKHSTSKSKLNTMFCIKIYSVCDKRVKHKRWTVSKSRQKPTNAKILRTRAVFCALSLSLHQDSKNEIMAREIDSTQKSSIDRKDLRQADKNGKL